MHAVAVTAQQLHCMIVSYYSENACMHIAIAIAFIYTFIPHVLECTSIVNQLVFQ